MLAKLSAVLTCEGSGLPPLSFDGHETVSGNGGVSVPRDTVRVLSTVGKVVPGIHGLPSMKPVKLV